MFDKDKLDTLLKDEAKAKELLSKESAEDAKAFLEENGVEISMEEVKAMGAILNDVAKGKVSAEDVEKAANGELSEEDLEAVAGGEIVTMGFIAACAIVGAVTGTGVTISILEWRW